MLISQMREATAGCIQKLVRSVFPARSTLRRLGSSVKKPLELADPKVKAEPPTAHPIHATFLSSYAPFQAGSLLAEQICSHPKRKRAGTGR